MKYTKIPRKLKKTIKASELKRIGAGWNPKELNIKEYDGLRKKITSSTLGVRVSLPFAIGLFFIIASMIACTKSVNTPAPIRQAESDSVQVVKPTPPPVVVGIDTITVYDAGYKVNVFMTISDTLGVVTIVATAPKVGQAIAQITLTNGDGLVLSRETVISFSPSGVTNTINVLIGLKYVTDIKLN